MSEKKLLPCPFCGGEALLEVVPPHKHKIAIFPDYEGGAFIECTKCTCAMSGDTEEAAVNAWNTRVPMQKIVERLEERKEGYLNQYEKTFTASSRRAYESYDDAIDIVKEEGGLDV